VASYFVDTSALCKRYIAEVGSTWVRSILDPTTGATVFIARVTTVEMVAAITRRERGGALTPVDATTAHAAFRIDLAQEYQVVEVTETLATQAMRLAETHGLRGYDAIQLAAALTIQTLRVTQQLPAMTLISADSELNAAAMAEGLTVEDPHAHP
jgi:predicted nucleic acid-binding protein